MEIPIIFIGFLYQLFVGAETGGPSIFSLVDTPVELFSTGEELKDSVNKPFIVSRAPVLSRVSPSFQKLIQTVFFFFFFFCHSTLNGKAMRGISFLKGGKTERGEKRTNVYFIRLVFDLM